MSTYTAKLSEIVTEHNLNIVRAASNYNEAVISTYEVNRPGLQLSGFYDYFENTRVQIIGMVETAYLTAHPSDVRRERFGLLFSKGVKTLIICHGVEPLEECLEMAEKHDVNILTTDTPTSLYLSKLTALLQFKLAPRCTMHGVLMEVHGVGLLITGDSGIGKSEVAVELLKRGHRLVSDDAVEMRRMPDDTVVGTAPELIKYYMELRGIGIIDVRRIFGVGAIKLHNKIDLVVKFETWDETKVYDRLGIDTHYTEIFDISIPTITVPVRPGRNLAVILEVAAMNNRQKLMGYNAAQALANKHEQLMFDQSY